MAVNREHLPLSIELGAGIVAGELGRHIVSEVGRPFSIGIAENREHLPLSIELGRHSSRRVKKAYS